VISALLLAILLLAVWLGFQGGAKQRRLSVGFTTAHGHFPESALLFADQIIVACVTNTGRSALTLENPYVQFENAVDRLVNDSGGSWNQ